MLCEMSSLREVTRRFGFQGGVFLQTLSDLAALGLLSPAKEREREKGAMFCLSPGGGEMARGTRVREGGQREQRFLCDIGLRSEEAITGLETMVSLKRDSSLPILLL